MPPPNWPVPCPTYWPLPCRNPGTLINTMINFAENAEWRKRVLHEQWLFCFDYDVSGADLCFDNLLRRYVDDGNTQTPVFYQTAREIYARAFSGTRSLFKYSLNLLKGDFIPDPVPAWTRLADGAAVVSDFILQSVTEDRYRLSLISFNDVSLQKQGGRDSLYNLIDDGRKVPKTVKMLHQLYRYLQSIDHYLAGVTVKNELELQAAYTLFDYFCREKSAESIMVEVRRRAEQKQSDFLDSLCRGGRRIDHADSLTHLPAFPPARAPRRVTFLP